MRDTLGEEINGFLVLRRLFDRDEQAALIAACLAVAAQAPFLTPTMPDGRPFRVEMTNAGSLGWLADRQGYRYAAVHPLTGRPWPAPPPAFTAGLDRALAASLGTAAAAAYAPQCFLINRYSPARGRLGLHRDWDERDRAQPIVTFSLGADAVFLAGGATRRNRVERLVVSSGDVVVMAGAARLAYHGIDKLLPGLDAPGDGSRLSITIRRVDPIDPPGANGRDRDRAADAAKPRARMRPPGV
jgi:DNA oxidative demethylase